MGEGQGGSGGRDPRPTPKQTLGCPELAPGNVRGQGGLGGGVLGQQLLTAAAQTGHMWTTPQVRPEGLGK